MRHRTRPLAGHPTRFAGWAALYAVAGSAGLLLACGGARAQDGLFSDPTPDLSGNLRAVYDYRRLGDDKDTDTYGYWTLRGRNLGKGRLEVYTSGRLHYDFDDPSQPLSLAEDPYIGMEDTSDEDEVRLLQLYGDLHTRDDRIALRAGRQYVDIADYIQMDGAQLMLFEQDSVGGRVFGGQPVSFYTPISGDLFGGASLVGRPLPGNRSRVTFARYEDDSRDATDEHFFLDTQQYVRDAFRARAYLSMMNDEFRMGGADLYYFSTGDDVFDIALGGRRWGEYTAETRAYSPLVEVLGAQEPYTYVYGRLTKELVPRILLSPGGAYRIPDDSDAQNREFRRFDISLIFEPSSSLSASVAVDYWDVEQDDTFLGLSGEVRYRFKRIWELTAGAAYLDYQYLTFSDFSLVADGGDTVVTEDGTLIEVSPDAYTYFLRGRWNITPHYAVRLEGELEDDSTEEDLGYRLRASIEVRL